MSELEAQSVAFEPVLAAILSELAKAPAFWKTSPRPNLAPGERGYITIADFSEDDTAVEETVEIEDPAGIVTEGTSRLVGAIVPFRIRPWEHALVIECVSFDESPAWRARHLLERIRANIRRDDIRARLAVVGAAFHSLGPTGFVPRVVDLLDHSTAFAELRLNRSTFVRDPNANYIETVELESSVDVDGTTVTTGSGTVDLG